MKIALSVCLAAVLALSCSQGYESKPLTMDKDTILIDVRTAREFKAGHLAEAINIPHGEIAAKIADHAKGKTDSIVLYCRSGYRASVAKKALEKSGYTAVVNAGSYARLKAREKKSPKQ